MSDAIVIAVLGMLQAISTATIGLLVRRNACGGERCRGTISNLERTTLGREPERPT